MARILSRSLRVGVVGAGNMGRGMALSLAESGHSVWQYDRSHPAMESSAAQHAGIVAADSIRACCKESAAVVVSVSHEAAEREVFLGDEGVLACATNGGVVLNTGTTSVSWARELHAAAAARGVRFLDAPVSGGPEGAARGALSIMVGGSERDYLAAEPLLEAMSATRARLGEAGAGAAAKLVNQLLVAANAHAAAEGLALARALGCDLDALSALLRSAWGQSTMLGRAAAQVVAVPAAACPGDDARPFAALLDVESQAPLRNFVKDVDLVLSAAAEARVATPSAERARRTLERCARLGRLEADWAAVAALVARDPVETTLSELAARAPPRQPATVVDDWRREIEARAAAAGPVPVVDDDPTGTQTVHSVAVLSYPWRESDLAREMAGRETPTCFFVLANTRALEAPAALERARTIGEQLRPYAPRCVVSRSDSTLRGHFPGEVDALAAGLGWTKPLIVVAPFFFEGGRLTVDDVHYVVADGRATPAAETEFARDETFGFASSNLRDWVREKGFDRGAVGIDLGLLRSGSEAPARVADRLCAAYAASDRPLVVCDALDVDDAVALALGALVAQSRLFADGTNGMLLRSAASLVAARCAVPPRPPLADREVAASGPALCVVGSYVGKTGRQLDRLFALAPWLARVELDADKVVRGDPKEPARVARALGVALDAGQSACVYTSRRVATDESASFLEIGGRVNAALCDVVREVVAPRPGLGLVAKGGITSNDVAVEALGVRRAMVGGQVVPGVPCWRLGPESLAPDSTYVVFPGNVGSDDDLATVVAKVADKPLAGLERPRLQDLLLEARARGRALGAFNVYNLEGAIAVRRAVEATGLPAIIQFHKASLDRGGAALVAACLEVARSAIGAPILVVLDHANDDDTIDAALRAGVDGIMADGSHLSFRDNRRWTADVVRRAKPFDAAVEAELGKLAGEEDGLSVDEREARMTDPALVADFVRSTNVAALACTIGNVHGKYARTPPELDWPRLDAIRAQAPPDLPLVLHGASGLPPDVLHRAIRAGVAKFNVNTEVRAASREALKLATAQDKDVLDIMKDNVDAMAAVVAAKIRAFAPTPRTSPPPVG